MMVPDFDLVGFAWLALKIVIAFWILQFAVSVIWEPVGRQFSAWRQDRETRAKRVAAAAAEVAFLHGRDSKGRFTRSRIATTRVWHVTTLDGRDEIVVADGEAEALSMVSSLTGAPASDLSASEVYGKVRRSRT